MNHTLHRTTQIRQILQITVTKLNPIFSRDIQRMICPLENGKNVRCKSDTTANLLALCSSLQSDWEDGKLYFEWLDAETELSSFSPVVFEGTAKEQKLELTELRLRFHWLSRTVSEALSAHHLDSADTIKGRAVKEIRLESEEDISAIISTILAIPSEKDHDMPIESGKLITCHAKTSDLDNTRTLFKLQEVYKKMACFSGAAHVAEYLDEDARHEPEIPPFIPKEWYERLARREAGRRAEASRSAGIQIDLA